MRENLKTMYKQIILYIFFYLFRISRADGYVKDAELEDIFKNHSYIFKCGDRNRIFGLADNDNNELVTATVSSNLILHCRFCTEDDKDINKIRHWYIKDRQRNETEKPVVLDSRTILSDSKVFTTLYNTLVINDVQKNDSGIYSCRGRSDEASEFVYTVDVIMEAQVVYSESVKSPREINLLHYYKAVNQKFEFGNGIFETIRNTGFDMQVYGKWNNIMPCDGCRGFQKRFAECTIDIRHDAAFNQSSLNLLNSNAYNVLAQSNEISCHSFELLEVLPEVSTQVSNHSNFMLTVPCYSPCWFSSGKKGLPKYKNTVDVHLDDSISFYCPEATVESNVVWKKNKKAFKKYYKSKHIEVDPLIGLHIYSATRKEQGTYTCFVEGQKMQEIIINVSRFSKIMKKEFFRHLQYVGLMMLACAIFYIAGIGIACSNRNSFKKITADKYFIKQPNYNYYRMQQL